MADDDEPRGTPEEENSFFGRMLKSIRNEVRDLKGDVDRRFEGVNERFEGVNGRFDEVNARLDAHWTAIQETRRDVAEIRAATPTNPADIEAVRRALGTLGEAFLRVARGR